MRHFYDQPEPKSIDLTPMLDVVFIMLIFFIVTATFTKEIGLDVNPPEPTLTPPPIKLTENILVSINSSNGISVAGRYVDIRNIRANLERLHAQDPKGALVIKAHPDSDNGTMVSVMDSARLTGIENIQFAQ